MKDYSQHGEQAVILDALSQQPKGRFLDIGGFNAFDLSNTRALYELGWEGVIVEPSPGPMRGLIEVYGEDPRIHLIQAFVVPPKAPEHLGPVKIHVSDDALSTSKEDCFERFSKHYKFIGLLWVMELDIDRLCNQFGPFDFASIDAEGLSVDIFYAMMARYYLPKVVCVEHEGDIQNCDDAAKHRDYRKIWSNSVNVIYQRP